MSSYLYVVLFQPWNRSCPISIVIRVDGSQVDVSDDNVPWIVGNALEMRRVDFGRVNYACCLSLTSFATFVYGCWLYCRR